MPSDAFHQLYYHFVWTTRNRIPLILEGDIERVVREVEAQCRTRGGKPLACNTMPDHIHVAVYLPPTACVSEFIGKVKGASSHNLAEDGGWEVAFGWQDGYGVVEFRRGELDKVAAYIANQAELHAKRKTSRIMETVTYSEFQRGEVSAAGY